MYIAYDNMDMVIQNYLRQGHICQGFLYLDFVEKTLHLL